MQPAAIMKLNATTSLTIFLFHTKITFEIPTVFKTLICCPYQTSTEKRFGMGNVPPVGKAGVNNLHRLCFFPLSLVPHVVSLCLKPSEFLGHYNYGNSFYAFTHGLTHTIVLNSYTDTMPDSVQYQWLDKELQSVDRTITPWLIVMYHCPLHTTFIGHNGEINGRIMLESMEPLFVQYQVNLIVSGHDHAFMRTHPMVGSQRDPSKKGPVYLTLGAGGNREQHSKGYIHDIPEDWVAKRDDTEYGYGHLFVANRTHAHFNWVRDGTTQDGTRDSVWLENQLFLEN